MDVTSPNGRPGGERLCMISDRTAGIVCSSILPVAEALIAGIPLRGAVAVRLDVTGDTLNAHFVRRSPSLVIVVSTDVGRAVAAIALAKRRRPAAKVLAVGVPKDEVSLSRFLQAGVDGVVSAEESLDELRAAVEGMRVGCLRRAPEPRRRRRRVAALDGHRTSRDGEAPARISSRLSRRELEVLRSLVEGATNKEVAVRLNVEVQTVKNYVNRVLRKLGVRTRYDAARVGRKILVTGG
jgi:DNA-binding NarL/FixJ family response regulator